MIQAAIIGGLLALGVWLVVRGWFPAPPTLSDRLADFSEVSIHTSDQTALRSLWGRIAMAMMTTANSGDTTDVAADVAVTDGDMETHALDKLNAGVGGAVLMATVGYLFGFTRSAFGIALVLIFGFVAFYFAPDVELKRKAVTRRDEFNESLTAFVSLVAVSISGGGGVNTAMADASKLGSGRPFRILQESIEDSALHGESPWGGFDALGQKLKIVPLIELAGALSLAGTSGARVTETLKARAESARGRELADATTAAEKKSESMNIPVAAMVLGWAGFMGYPAVAGLLGI
ncbi:MAG: type II secretion system F family protein [Ilumatobacter sp.]|uniref:type II secretion system F family protein n=1 Tax=Ilumatobacter sp. TaxID=1967498 RepID=UPI0032992D82